MWLTSSSIGRKVVMSVTGTALILFLTFHMAMNLVYIFSPEGYNTVCEFLGANWYAVAATGALALLFVIHIIYAFWLNLQNHRARGHERYAVSGKQPIEWSSKNMLALGVIVILGLLLHFFNFWYNMMFAELSGVGNQELAADGSHYIVETFKCPVYVVLYVIWIGALWFHLNHGFWSAMQTLGWSGKIWLNRWICISRIYSTIICLGFLAVLLFGVLRANGCGACC
jgi:succinate dehydrogenase / fumarate reductase cytochrome b subunit